MNVLDITCRVPSLITQSTVGRISNVLSLMATKAEEYTYDEEVTSVVVRITNNLSLAGFASTSFAIHEQILTNALSTIAIGSSQSFTGTAVSLLLMNSLSGSSLNAKKSVGTSEVTLSPSFTSQSSVSSQTSVQLAYSIYATSPFTYQTTDKNALISSITILEVLETNLTTTKDLVEVKFSIPNLSNPSSFFPGSSSSGQFNKTCVAWNPSTGVIATDACYVLSSDTTSVTCSCSSFGAFGVAMEYTQAPVTPGNSKKNSSSGLSGGAIAGIVIAICIPVLVILAIIVIVVVIVLFRLKGVSHKKRRAINSGRDLTKFIDTNAGMEMDEI